MQRESVVARRGIPGEAPALPTPSQGDAGHSSRAPGPPDTREAFIPLTLSMPDYYLCPPSSRWLLFKAAVALGFHAMLRFGAFSQLTPKSLTLVFKCGRELPLTSINQVAPNLDPKRLLGVLFTFTLKYTLRNGLGRNRLFLPYL